MLDVDDTGRRGVTGGVELVGGALTAANAVFV